MILELAVQSAAGVRIAAEVGADRVELCVGLGATGGLTPTLGLIEAAVEVGVPVHPLIRLRPGDYVYDGDEVAAMAADVAHAVHAGATGVVVGALTEEGRLDLSALSRFKDAAGGAEITCHRAMDRVADRLAAIDELVELGFARVLTSAGEPSCATALAGLAEMTAHGAGRIQIQAGGGVTPALIPDLARAGVDAVHLSAKRTGPARCYSGRDAHEETDPELAAAAAAAAQAL